MATAPIPIQSQQPQQPQPSKLADLLTTAHGALSSVRDHYADLVNRVADTITQHTPNYSNMPPETQRDLGTVVRTGLGAYGIPVTPRGAGEMKNDIENPSESVITPKGGEEVEALPGLKGVKIPKGQMKPDQITSAIEDAAMKNHSLVMTYQNPEWDEPKIYHVEPYSYRQTSGDQTLMAFDKVGKGIRAFKTDNIVNVAPTGQEFKPRWEVEVAPKLAKSEQGKLKPTSYDPDTDETQSKETQPKAEGRITKIEPRQPKPGEKLANPPANQPAPPHKMTDQEIRYQKWHQALQRT